jgi:tetratricopeptide (TPR) repeat protein
LKKRSNTAPAAVRIRPRGDIRRRALLIAVAVVVTYWNSLSGPFIFDDQLSIVENQQIRQLTRPASVLFPERELPTAGRPVVNVSFAINYAADRLDVRGYHAWNIAVHLLCALLIFGIVRRTLELAALQPASGSTPTNLALACALIWALHPVNTEAVDYLTQRTESMMAMFYLLTLYASIRAAGRGRLMWQTLAIVSCVLGMACKESMVTAPFVVIVYDGVFAFSSLGEALRSRWRFYAGLASSWLVLALLLWSGPRIHSAGFSTGIGSWTYLLNQTRMITRYLWLAVWPRSLVLNYGSPEVLTLGEVLPEASLIVTLLLLTLVALKRRPRLGFLGLWFFVTLAPTSSVVPIATEAGAERRMYLPLIALVVLAVMGGSRLWTAVTRRWTGSARRVVPLTGAFIVAMVSVALAAGTMARNREYASGLSLARTVLERRPSSIAHHMVGAELLATGQREEAVAELREAVRGEPRARYTLGAELFDEGKLNEAIDELQIFVHDEPLLLEVIPARTMLAEAFAKQARWAQAVEQFRLILVMRPADVNARGRLADVLLGESKFDESIERYREYLAVRPNDVGALENLGIALAAIMKLDDAILAFRRGVELDPRNASARRNLTMALLDNHDADGAVPHAREGVALTPGDPAAHDLLGRVLGIQGKLDEARIQFEESLRIDPGYAQAREDLRAILRVRRAS